MDAFKRRELITEISRGHMGFSLMLPAVFFFFFFLVRSRQSKPRSGETLLFCHFLSYILKFSFFWLESHVCLHVWLRECMYAHACVCVRVCVCLSLRQRLRDFSFSLQACWLLSPDLLISSG